MSNRVLASGLDRVVHPKDETRETKLFSPSQAQKDAPFFHLLPTDPIKLLKWKIYVRQRCVYDLEFRRLVLEAGRRDILFFAATFVWIFEPRPPRAIPFTPWCDQADVISWMVECIFSHRDMGVEKSRGIGMSWNIIIVFYWLWFYTSEVKLGCMSKDEAVLDGDDANYLLGKFVYIHEHMPYWARCDENGNDILSRNRTRHTLINLRNGGTFQGFPSTDSKVRSLRFTAFFYDEFAFFSGNVQEQLNSSVHTAPSRIFISTWNGSNNVFHSIMRRLSSTMLRVLSYWWANPERWKGAYRFENGRINFLDPDYQHTPDYPFVEDGLLRSPWVDFELSRAGSDMQTSLEELYGLQAESGRKFFRSSTVDIMDTSSDAPRRVGGIVKVKTGWEFQDGYKDRFDPGKGDIRVWGDVGEGRGGPFVAGCDLSFGAGASYSTLEVIDVVSGSQVLEFGSNLLNPDEFCEYVVRILGWLNGPNGDSHTLLNFENNGEQGNIFGRTLRRIGYGNVSRRNYSYNISRGKEQEYLGMKNKDGGMMIFVELERAVRAGELHIKSNRIGEEASNYDKDEKGKPEYPRTLETHGDYIMGLALSWEEAKDRVGGGVRLPEEASPYAELMNITPDEDRPLSAGWRRNTTGGYF